MEHFIFVQYISAADLPVHVHCGPNSPKSTCSMKICYEIGFPFENNPRNLDPSYKMDLDFWDCFGREKLLSLNRRNMVSPLPPAQPPNEGFINES